ncbi:general transcription factor 3C polypeptide 2 isoform X2 [Hippoglossus hippoglossus]|uniref:general transcription factor 3C polypeptide 2 isoform X2 n=1 Tax=Hippoglossus hippoglossus TaxID=8267 RepID=UPI00148DE0FE|nr:general transcription factor 3C polypeptide 2 isoform X2 [Hippoglossus hippoglossus]
MESTDPGPGQEKPSAQNQELTPSSRGRQRKKNSKYADFETDDKSTGPKTPRKRSGGGRTPSNTSPAKSEDAKNATQPPADKEKEATDTAAQESDGKTSEESPKKAARAKRTPSKQTPAKQTPAKQTPAKQTPAKQTPAKQSPAKKTPAKKSPAKKTPAKKSPAKKTPAKKTPAKKTPAKKATGEDGAVEAAQQENGTPKPKRKYVRKQPAQETLVAEAPAEEAQGEHAVPPEETLGPGGRRRRGAATAALKYLQILAKEVFGNTNDDSQPGANSKVDSEGKGPRGSKARKGKKRKRRASNSSGDDDDDFVPGAEEDEGEEMEEEEEEEEVEESDLDLDFGNARGSPAVFHINRNNIYSNAKTKNGLTMRIMASVWSSFETTKKFREEHFSSWVFPEWVPSTSNWHLVAQSDVEKYLPQELRSAAFKVSRDGLGEEETSFQSLNRFEAVPAHTERWDMLLYAGGPVWAMEWCPTPDGAPATQYIAVACHRGMDDQHYVNKTYTGPGLIQLWDVGKMEYNSSPDSQPALAYGLAQDKGFIWNLKWCPAGGWELPSCGRKAPFLPRLGLLAAASSSGVVTIYSLPHPAALHSNKKLPDSGDANQQLPIYKADAVLTLKLGSLKAPRHENSGQVLSMDWLPEKPHNIIAIGFYDGVVGLWDLSTKSTLLQMRESDGSLTLLPFRCLLAHDHAVRALAFCPASRNLLVTAGEDRYMKTWDLKRLDHPVTVQKRYLTNEIHWPLNAPGYLVAQDAAYVAKGSHGVHFFDHYMQSVYAVPRTGSLWSLSYTDWMNSVVTADSLGELIFAILPPISHSSPYIKRTIERRFPIYITSLVPHATTEEETPEMGGAAEEEEGGGEVGGEVGEQDPGSEAGDENVDENGREGRRGRNNTSPPLRFQTYKEASKKYCLHHSDGNMLSFVGSEKQATWKHMKDTELKTVMNMDEMQLAALHKVRFNPNMSCHIWVASGGQTGLVRLNCLRSMISPKIKNKIRGNQAQFNALYSPTDQTGPVQTEAEQL